MRKKLKQTNIPWLGEIPEGWGVKRLKDCIVNKKSGSWGDDKKGDDNDIVCIRIADFNYSTLSCKNHSLTYRNIIKPKRLIDESFLLIEKSGGGEKNPVGRVVRYNLKYKATTSNFIESFQLKKDNIRFFNYLFSLMYYCNVVLRYIKQTIGIQNLDVNNFFLEKVPIPPLQEQEAIARYLDKRCYAIDKVIELQKTLVKKLKEYKQSLIYECVTKGLNI